MRPTSESCLCPFLVSAKLTDVGWKLKVVDGKHNHGPTPDLLGHPQVRRPTVEDVQQVMELSNANVAPKQIVGVLRNKPNKLLLARDVGNIKLLERKKELGGYTPTQALVKELEQKEKWTYVMQTSVDGTLKRLFFAYVPNRKYALLYHHVLVID